MPSQPKANSVDSKSKAVPSADETEAPFFQADREPGVRTGRKKSKHASSKQNEATEAAPLSEVARDPSPFKGQPILGHIPRSFPTHRHPSSDDLLEELNTTEKVEDQHTPPQDAFVPEAPYARSPRPDQIPGLSYAVSPSAQPSYIGQGGFNTRSPPTSPPQVKARPVSYGGPPTAYGYPRMSTSPYQRPALPYGSPPALPHLPQQHFYNAQDINLGIANRPESNRSRPPGLMRFTRFPGSTLQSSEALLVGLDAHLDLLEHNGESIHLVGALSQLPGLVQDATFLTWSTGPDPFADVRPLLAVILHDSACLEPENHERPSSRLSSYEASEILPGFGTPMTSVVVYSVRQQAPVAELMRVPTSVPHHHPQGLTKSGSPKHPLTLQASGNHLIVSSGLSGEVFVFGASAEGSVPRFQCLTKLWTALQPQVQRRDSSHSRAAEADASPADQGRGQDLTARPIVALNGRWLAYCPSMATTSMSVGAVVGNTVNKLNNSMISSRGPPSRPTINCEVDSPDADTLLSKVAKGAAQGLLKGGKWLGEKGWQAWKTWSQDPSANLQPSTTQRSPIYSPQLAPAQFPPTHGESFEVSMQEPEFVSIVDLQSAIVSDSRKISEASPAFATFQPPGGCSFLSFAPNGLSMLTANRKGEVQYVWDLFQIHNPRMAFTPQESETGNFPARARQIAKFERFSPSMIVDVQWDGPLGHRFATLTQNRTVHIFDLPATALRWPPPRKGKKPRPLSAPAEKPESVQAPSTSTGFFASAMNLASSAQPMLANLRGRAPSASGGVSGIGASGMGIASATGMRSGKVVAAGFSRSLGAASDTVAHIRHAGQSKLHLRGDAVPTRMAWRKRGQRTALCVLDATGVKVYYIRKTNPRERQLETVTVFDARKAVSQKLPDDLGPRRESVAVEDQPREGERQHFSGFWKPDHLQDQKRSTITTAPLSFAEIETNPPYQPFHSDHKVRTSVYADESQMSEDQVPTVSVMFQAPSPARWVFGGPIRTKHINVTSQTEPHSSQQDQVMYRETAMVPGEGDEGREQIVSTTRRRKPKKLPEQAGGDATNEENGEGVFEDEPEVLDFDQDRV